MVSGLRAVSVGVLSVAAVTATSSLGLHSLGTHQKAAKPVNAGTLAIQDSPEPKGRVEYVEAMRLMAADKAAADKAAADKAAADAAAKLRKAPPPASSFGTGPIQDIITKAFTPYGPTAVAWGLRVAHCESGYNPRAYNAAGPYYGLFQFLMSTFKATPYGSGDIYDPVANANAAAWKYANGGASAWGCK